MAKTDGYITNKSDGDWRYSNTGQGSRGDVEDSDLESPAYLRVERDTAGAIAGTKVDTEGVVSAGPIVTFDDLNSLLDGAAAQDGNKPWIVWAGISPMSLSEALIVWNQPIVLLDQAKITGGTGVISVAGRCLIVQLADPVAIDGEEKKIIKIAPGAVGQYLKEATEICPPADNTTVNTPSGDLDPLPTPSGLCNCGDVPKVGAGLGDQAGGQGANVLNALLFAEQLCQTGDCDPPQVEPQLGFIINNGMHVPVRCCHPFMLQQLFVNGTGGDCPCEECPVWMACLWVFGSTIPLEVLAVDQLLTIANDKLCDFAKLFGDGSGHIPGVLQDDALCCAPCSIQIVGNAGPEVTVDSEWRGEIPGVAGQSAYLIYKNETGCDGTTCQNVAHDDTPADTWNEEGIIKPVPRVLPVAFFDSLGFNTSSITVPQFTTGTPVTAITTCPMTLITNLTGSQTVTINNITSLSEQTLTAFGTAGVLDICAWTSCPTLEEQAIIFLDPEGTRGSLVDGVAGPFSVAMCPTSGAWLTGFGTTVISVCVDGSMVDVTVVTSIETEAVICTNVSLVTIGSPVGASIVEVFPLGTPSPTPVSVINAAAAVAFTNVIPHTTAVSVIQSLTTATINVVTSCMGQNVALPQRLPDIIIKSLSVNTVDPDISLLIPTTPSCDRPYKFAMHDGTPLQWTRVITDFHVPCAPDNCNSTPESLRHCISFEEPMPNEVNCMNINLLRANYVSRTETQDTGCMGYDCSPEGETTPPKSSNVANGSGGPVPCGILIRRPRRRTFLKCTGS